MTTELWLTFVITAMMILAIPGPTNIFIVGQSLAHGRKASIPLSLGVISGDALCITLSLLGLSSILTLCSAAFLVVKYLGAAYLVYLGVKMIISNSHLSTNSTQRGNYSSKVVFRDIFVVNALNPKGIIFYSAFMPQFITSESNFLIQYFLLSLTFIGLALLNVLFYSLLSSKVSELWESSWLPKSFNITGGFSLICAGVYSAAIERK